MQQRKKSQEKGSPMNEDAKLVAVISPWEKLSELIKRKFRVESLPAEHQVMVWREDLQTKEELCKELAEVGLASAELRTRKVTSRWQDTE